MLSKNTKKSKQEEIPFKNMPPSFKVWFLKNSVNFTNFDRPTSLKVSKKIHGELGACHDNTILANQHVFDCEYKHFTGYARFKQPYRSNGKTYKIDVNTTHSWLVSPKTGLVIDPTLSIPAKVVSNGTKIITQNVKPHEDYKRNSTVQYIGVEIPLSILTEIYKYKESRYKTYQHHILEEYYLMSYYGLKVGASCPELATGQNGYNEFMKYFFNVCHSLDKLMRESKHET